jgi:hypothetical protein
VKASLAIALGALSMFTAGCASTWGPRSTTHATIYAETTEIPVLWADNTFVDAVDGTAVEKGKSYVLVEPGHRTLTIFHISCPLPVIAVLCLHSATRRHIQSYVAAGASYRIRSDELVEVSPNGRARDRASNSSP